MTRILDQLTREPKSLPLTLLAAALQHGASPAVKGQGSTPSERTATPAARSEPGPALLPRPPAAPPAAPAGRAPSDPRGQEPALPGPAAHAPAGRSSAEARGGAGVGRSAQARRGRCHPPQGAGPAAAVRDGPGSGDGKDRRAGVSPLAPRLAGFPHPTEVGKSRRGSRTPPSSRLTGISAART